MNLEEHYLALIALVVGLAIGYLICYFMNKGKDKAKLNDELIKAKRELATQRNQFVEFFNSSNALFEQLESSYQAYCEHMNAQARKIYPQLGSLYVTASHKTIKIEKEDNLAQKLNEVDIKDESVASDIEVKVNISEDVKANPESVEKEQEIPIANKEN